MQTLIILTLRILAVISGIILIYAAFFLYEDEQGKIQNFLEDLWIRIDDRRNTALSKHATFMQVVAKYISTIFDRVFGDRLWVREVKVGSLKPPAASQS